MKSKNPNSGCRKTDIAKTFDTSDARPGKNQGGIAILDMPHANDVIRECGETVTTLTSRMGTGGNQVPITMRYRSFGDYEPSEYAFALKAQNTVSNSDVVCVFGLDCRNGRETKELCGTLQSKPNGGYSYNFTHPIRIARTYANGSFGEYQESNDGSPCLQGNGIDRSDTAGCNGRGWRENQSNTLNTVDRPAVCAIPDKNQGGMAILDMPHANDVIRECGEIVPTLQSRMGTGGNQVPIMMRYRSFEDYEPSEHASTLKARNTPDNSDVVCEMHTYENGDFGKYYESNVSSTCLQRDYKGATNLVLKKFVRRLTPLECERLQGFPDGWTDIGDWTDSKGRTRKTSDAARYKALGNSIALPPWKWVLKRLCAEYERDATMGSLFDGIGGFPLIWEQFNGRGSCLWASEIEEFCIAVTKRRFEG